MTPIRLITLDLDDTLWPCLPVIRGAEEALFGWLGDVAAGVTEAYGMDGLREHRLGLRASRPDIAHDLTELRLASLRLLLAEQGYSPGLADEGVALFLEHRNRVTPFPDVAPGLARLAERFLLVSVTNGNADVQLTPLRGLFHYSVSAATAGAAKPDPAMFRQALERFGLSSGEALHLGDDPLLDVEAARRFGMAGAWMDRTGAPWPDDLPPPDLRVADLFDLIRWLESDPCNSSS